MKKEKDKNIETNQTDESVPHIGITSNLEEKQKEIDDLQAKVSDLENKVKYAQAELVNYRKRKDDEVNNMLKFANQDLIVDLLPILDNFDRALKFDENKLDDASKKFLEGFKILYNSYNETLKKYGIEEIETVGKEFDPMLHEALMVNKDETKPNEVVLECLLKGYTLKGKVIRPAKVVVNQLDE
jgi:molecular chaperone GrpE